MIAKCNILTYWPENPFGANDIPVVSDGKEEILSRETHHQVPAAGAQAGRVAVHVLASDDKRVLAVAEIEAGKRLGEHESVTAWHIANGLDAFGISIGDDQIAICVNNGVCRIFSGTTAVAEGRLAYPAEMNELVGVLVFKDEQAHLVEVEAKAAAAVDSDCDRKRREKVVGSEHFAFWGILNGRCGQAVGRMAKPKARSLF